MKTLPNKTVSPAQYALNAFTGARCALNLQRAQQQTPCPPPAADPREHGRMSTAAAAAAAAAAAGRLARVPAQLLLAQLRARMQLLPVTLVLVLLQLAALRLAVAVDVISSSKLESCIANGTQGANATAIVCQQKLVVVVAVDSGDAIANQQLSFQLACVGSPTGQCPCPCNYAADPTCSCRDLAASITVQLTKGPLWSSYPLQYMQSFNFKPYEAIVRPGAGNCRDGAFEDSPTCGWYYSLGRRVPDSQGFACECETGLVWDSTFGTNTQRTRANLDCDLFSNPLDILLGKMPCSGHCLMMDAHWYGGYSLGEASMQFEITAAISVSSSATAGAAAASSTPGNGEALKLSPSLPQAVSSNRTLSAKLLGDLAAYTELPVLSERLLMIPHPRSGQSVQDVFNNRTEWMLLDRSRVSFDGSECDKVGTSFTAFRFQTGGCRRAPQVCLTNQLKDILAADQARIAAGRVPLYLVSQYTYGLDSQLRAFAGGPLAFALPVPGIRRSLVQLEAAAESLRFVTNTSPGKILAARMCAFAETRCGGFEASAARGYLHAWIANRGTLAASYTLAVTNCSVNVRPVEAQRLALEPGANGTAPPFQIFVEDDAAAAERYCWLRMLDSLGVVTDTVRVTFFTNATAYEDWPTGGLLSNGTGEGNATSKAGCVGKCANSFDLLCAVKNQCWGNFGRLMGLVVGTIAGLSLLALALKMGWIGAALQCCCGGAGAGGGLLSSCGGSGRDSRGSRDSRRERADSRRERGGRASESQGRRHSSQQRRSASGGGDGKKQHSKERSSRRRHGSGAGSDSADGGGGARRSSSAAARMGPPGRTRRAASAELPAAAGMLYAEPWQHQRPKAGPSLHQPGDRGRGSSSVRTSGASVAGGANSAAGMHRRSPQQSIAVAGAARDLSEASGLRQQQQNRQPWDDSAAGGYGQVAAGAAGLAAARGKGKASLPPAHLPSSSSAGIGRLGSRSAGAGPEQAAYEQQQQPWMQDAHMYASSAAGRRGGGSDGRWAPQRQLSLDRAAGGGRRGGSAAPAAATWNPMYSSSSHAAEEQGSAYGSDSEPEELHAPHAHAAPQRQFMSSPGGRLPLQQQQHLALRRPPPASVAGAGALGWAQPQVSPRDISLGALMSSDDDVEGASASRPALMRRPAHSQGPDRRWEQQQQQQQRPQRMPEQEHEQAAPWEQAISGGRRGLQPPSASSPGGSSRPASSSTAGFRPHHQHAAPGRAVLLSDGHHTSATAPGSRRMQQPDWEQPPQQQPVWAPAPQAERLPYRTLHTAAAPGSSTRAVRPASAAAGQSPFASAAFTQAPPGRRPSSAAGGMAVARNSPRSLTVRPRSSRSLSSRSSSGGDAPAGLSGGGRAAAAPAFPGRYMAARQQQQRQPDSRYNDFFMP